MYENLNEKDPRETRVPAGEDWASCSKNPFSVSDEELKVTLLAVAHWADEQSACFSN